MRQGLHSNTSLYTFVPDAPAAIHDQQSLHIWRDGAPKGKAHLALQLEGEGKTMKIPGTVEVPTEKYRRCPKPDEHVRTLSSINRFLRLELYWPVIIALKSSPDPDAAAAINTLHSEHANVELQRAVFKLLKCYRFSTLAAAINYTPTVSSGIKRKYYQTAPASIPLKSSPPLPPPPLPPTRQLPPLTPQT